MFECNYADSIPYSILKYSFIFSRFFSYVLFKAILISSTLVAIKIPLPYDPDSGLHI